MGTSAYRNFIAVIYLGNCINTEYIIAICGQDAEVSNVETDGTYISYHIGKG
jgi:hypothetical protein